MRWVPGEGTGLGSDVRNERPICRVGGGRLLRSFAFIAARWSRRSADKARNYRNGVDAALPASELELRFAEVEMACVPFDDALMTLSRHGEPTVLRPFATGEAALAPEQFATAWRSAGSSRR